MPTAAEADAAYAELKKLLDFASATPAQRKTRADLLMKAKRYTDAVDEYRDLASHATPETRPAAELALADALHRSGRNREAKAEVTDSARRNPGPECAASCTFSARLPGLPTRTKPSTAAVDELRQAAPTSPWLEQALLSVANLASWCITSTDQALDTFRELQQRFPTGSHASYAHWKAAWLTLRMGRNDDAKKQFEEQIALYPAGTKLRMPCTGARAWRRKRTSPAWPAPIIRNYPTAIKQLLLRGTGPRAPEEASCRLPFQPGKYPLLDRIPPLDHGGESHAGRSSGRRSPSAEGELLGNGGLVDFAVHELQAAATSRRGNWRSVRDRATLHRHRSL